MHTSSVDDFNVLHPNDLNVSHFFTATRVNYGNNGRNSFVGQWPRDA